MSILNKAGFALVALSAMGLTTSAHALANITVTPAPVTGGPGAFTYSYNVSPTDFNASQLGFTFSDPNVSFSSVTGPLNNVSETPVDSGNFVNFSSTKGKFLTAGSVETIVFTSPDGPNGTLAVSGTGLSGKKAMSGYAYSVVGPDPVPEASTTVSFGLLLALGLGGVAIAARKKSIKA